VISTGLMGVFVAQFGAATVLMTCGVISEAEALSGFSNEGCWIVLVLLVVAKG
jgi:hypothetical protein